MVDGPTALRRRCDSEILNRQQCAEWDAARFEGGAATLKSIDDPDRMNDFAAKFLDSIDRLQSAAAGGDDVIDNHHFVTGLNRTFDIALSPVAFCFFANHEALQWAILGGGGDEDAADDRIGSNRHAAEAAEFNVLQKFQQAV